MQYGALFKNKPKTLQLKNVKKIQQKELGSLLAKISPHVLKARHCLPCRGKIGSVIYSQYPHLVFLSFYQRCDCKPHGICWTS